MSIDGRIYPTIGEFKTFDNGGKGSGNHNPGQGRGVGKPNKSGVSKTGGKTETFMGKDIFGNQEKVEKIAEKDGKYLMGTIGGARYAFHHTPISLDHPERGYTDDDEFTSGPRSLKTYKEMAKHLVDIQETIISISEDKKISKGDKGRLIDFAIGIHNATVDSLSPRGRDKITIDDNFLGAYTYRDSAMSIEGQGRKYAKKLYSQYEKSLEFAKMPLTGKSRSVKWEDILDK